jgi:transposase
VIKKLSSDCPDQPFNERMGHGTYGIDLISSTSSMRVFLHTVLLPYSPDLNPIEQSFAKLKAHPRKFGERSVPALWDRIGTILQNFAPQECKNYFAHVGYGSN